MNPSTPAARQIVTIYVSLLVLLGLSAAASFLAAGPWRSPIGIAIAVAKTALIFIYFMRLRASRGIVRIWALAGFAWLVIAIALMMADYLSRGFPAG